MKRLMVGMMPVALALALACNGNTVVDKDDGGTGGIGGNGGTAGTDGTDGGTGGVAGTGGTGGVAGTGGTAPPLDHPSIYAGTGANGSQLYDACGDPFVPIGVNHHGFVNGPKFGGPPPNLDAAAFPEIAKAGANIVQITWGTPTNYAHPGHTLQELDVQVQAAIDAGIFPIVGMGDALGPGNWAALETILQWLESPEVIAWVNGTDPHGHKRSEYLILHLAKEAGPATGAPYADFINRYVDAIQRLRSCAPGAPCYTMPFIISSDNWGRDYASVIAGAPTWLAADPLKNIMLSWELYDALTPDQVTARLNSLAATGLPVLLTEFANKESPNTDLYPKLCGGPPLPYTTLMAEAAKHGMGWMPWAWGDKTLPNEPADYWNGGCWEYDMTDTEKCSSLERWGCEVAITHPDSIKNRAIRPQYIVNRCGTEAARPGPGPCGDTCAQQSGFICSDPDVQDQGTTNWLAIDGGSDAESLLVFSVWFQGRDIGNGDQGIWIAPGGGTGPGGAPGSRLWEETSMRVRTVGTGLTATIQVLNGTGTVGVPQDDVYACDNGAGNTTCPTIARRQWHRLRFVANLATHTYDVYLTATCGDGMDGSALNSAEVKIASHFFFGTDTAAIAAPQSLRYWGMWGANGTGDTEIRTKNARWNAD